jgi:GTP cyclohydrolase I
MENNLPDIQASEDARGLNISRVGVKDIDFLMDVKTKHGESQVVSCKVNLYASLLHSVKGTNMSRFVEVLMNWRGRPICSNNIKEFLFELKKRVEADDVFVEVSFKYFIDKEAPVSKKRSVMGYNCSFIGHLNAEGEKDFVLKVEVPVTALCPCSKHISDYSAHNQRNLVTVNLKSKNSAIIWIEDVVSLIEESGSCEVYPLLKRVDEKYVTEKAYDNAKFVEDIARDVALKLQKIESVVDFRVKSESFESIHNHSAVAYISRARRNNEWQDKPFKIMSR